MRIQALAPISSSRPLAFKSLDYKPTQYRDINGHIRTSQNTTGMRNDLSYTDLAEIIKYRFSDFDRVNIMPMNVSDGTEAYFIANALIDVNGLDKCKKKYFPICASDIDSEVINKYGKAGVVYLSEYEKNLLNSDNSNIFNVCDEFELRDESAKGKLCKLSDEHKNNFNFEVNDFQQRLKDFEDEGNSVIIIRNCLRQSFGDIDSAVLVFDIAEKLKGESLLVIGDADRVRMPFFNNALNICFKEIKHNIFEKRGDN